jgi:hypothetical protein
MSNPFSIFLTSVVTIHKSDGSISPALKASVENNRIEIHDTSIVIEQGDFAIRDLPNGQHEYYEVRRVEYKDGIAGHIPQFVVLHCGRRTKSMPSFGSHSLVTIVRARGTPDEKSWQAQMGGDLARKALFYIDDRIKTGDEIHCELFDEPKIISKVDPSLMLSGVSHWEAEMMPQSEWDRRHGVALPQITVTGQGARINIGSADHSSQHFHNAQSDAAVLQALEEIKAAIAQHVASPAESKDASLDVEQLKMELQRSKPDQNSIGKFIDRLNGLAGLADKVTKLTVLLRSLGLFHHKG